MALFTPCKHTLLVSSEFFHVCPFFSYFEVDLDVPSTLKPLTHHSNRKIPIAGFYLRWKFYEIKWFFLSDLLDLFIAVTIVVLVYFSPTELTGGEMMP